MTTAAAALAVPDTTGARGIGDPYFPSYGNGGYDVGHYRIDTTYRTRSGRLTGTTRIQAVAKQPLTRFNLDFALVVDSVTVDGQAARFRQPDRHELVVRPRQAIDSGAGFSVAVTYHGNPERVVAGGLAPWISAQQEALAVGEPEIAAWWFPSNDHPRDKATFDIVVRVPRGQQAVSNGVLVARSRGSGKPFTSFHWRMKQPMATYLAFFAAGRFRMEKGTAEGLPYVNAVSRMLRKSEQERSLRLLRRTPKVVAWLADHYGDYPYASTGGVVTGLFTGFALENQSRPVYPYTGASRASTSLVVHEQAHQWFGDDVSVDRWRDIWLNEGFATFAEWQWAEEQHGKDAATRLENRYQAHTADDRFWRVRIGNPGRAHLFNWAVYERGAMALQALRNRIGEATFESLLQTWVTEHAGSTARISQFRQLAEQTSGQDLRGFFHAWLFDRARPAHTSENGLP